MAAALWKLRQQQPQAGLSKSAVAALLSEPLSVTSYAAHAAHACRAYRTALLGTTTRWAALVAESAVWAKQTVEVAAQLHNATRSSVATALVSDADDAKAAADPALALLQQRMRLHRQLQSAGAEFLELYSALDSAGAALSSLLERTVNLTLPSAPSAAPPVTVDGNASDATVAATTAAVAAPSAGDNAAGVGAALATAQPVFRTASLQHFVDWSESVAVMYRREVFLKRILIDALTALHDPAASAAVSAAAAEAVGALGVGAPTSQGTTELYLSAWLLEPYLDAAYATRVVEQCSAEID